MKKQILHMLRRPLSITWLARNATKQYLLLVTLLFAFALTAQAQYETVVTTSNGCSGEGTYEFTTLENGKPKYNHTSPFYTLQWYDNKWIIADPDYPQFPAFENTADTPIPPCDGWVNLYSCPWAFSLVSGCYVPPPCPPFFTAAAGGMFENVSESDIAFADVDGDGDMDVLITGDNTVGGGNKPGEAKSLVSGPLAKLYINDANGVYTEALGTPFEGVSRSSVAFADVNGDTYPDVLITGSNTSFAPSAKLYTNDGTGTFTEVMGTPFVGVESGSVAFADVDGDMDKDVLITGNAAGFAPVAKLYTNNGSGVFTEVAGTPFEAVGVSSIAFADVDGDMDQDVLITGSSNANGRIAKLYTNSGSGTFTEVMGTPFTGVSNSSIAFADVDGDTDQDVLITGRDNGNAKVAKLYTNNGTGTFTEATGSTFEGASNSSVAFADMNGDTYPDVLITGQNADFENVTKLYINDGTGVFSEATGTSLGGVSRGSVAFADVDGDMDMDVMITGESPSGNPFTQLYLNDNEAAVTITADPGNNITASTSVTFTATPTNGGDTPSYQWKVNGTEVGTDQDTYTSTTLEDGDEITCVMTSNDPCADPAMATSNAVTMTVTPAINGPVCTDYTTYTQAANGMSADFFAYNNSIFVDGTNIYACIGGNGLDISNNGGTSFTLKTTANGLANNDVKGVYADGTTVFAATQAGLSQSTDGGNSFTTNASLGTISTYCIAVSGSNVYVGTQNGVAISTDNGATFTTSNLGALISSIAVSGTTIVAGNNQGFYFSTNSGSSFTQLARVDGLATNSVTSVAVVGGTMYVALGDELDILTFNIIPGGVDIITNNGTTITHKTTADGLGNSNVNGIQVIGTTVYAATNGGLSISTNGDTSFTNYTTSNTTGLAANFIKTIYVTSEKIQAGTSSGLSVCGACSPVTPSVSITADPGNNITASTSVTFTATPTNGGDTPSYQWKVNGTNVGMDQDTYTSATLADGDEVTCEMTSSAPCADPAMATSDAITMTVTDPCAGITNRIYVTPTGTGNGSSWANATSDLQAAIDNTCGVTEIWMAAGTYKPAGYPTGCTTCTSPRDYAFMLKDGIKIYGGFVGTETALSERVPGNETILSGDVDNNDIWDSGNAYHLLISVTDSDISLDGLTVKHAYGADNNEFHTLEGERIFKRQGALYLVAATGFTFNDVDFVENSGNLYGAGIYIEETGGVNAITNCQFTDNVSGSYAGGIYLEYSGENGGHTNIDSCQFTNNEASSYAGAIYVLSYSNDTISHCQFTGNTSDDGAAIYLNYQGSGTATTIVGCTFDDNEADSEGGAVYLYEPEGNYVLDSCQFNGNYAGESGGAIYMLYSGYDEDNYTSINGCEFTENYAYEYGGAIYSEESYGNDVISNCTFTRDSSDYVGGAICLLYSGYNEINYTTITGCEFTENYAYEYGGAIYTEESYGNDVISNCQFTDNKSDYYGGGIYFYSPSENGDNYPTVMDCMFTGNVSAEEGGAVYSDSGDGTQIIRSTFLENEAPIGGGVYLYDYSTYITDCLFAKNTATTDVGGGLYTYSDDLELINCTFADNVATALPGAGIANEGTMNMVNTILWGNVQQGSGTTGQQQLFNDGGTVNISYSLIQDGMPDGVTDGGNNIHVDPLFTDAANDDYTLQNCSPAINIGDNTGVSATDLAGNARIQNGTVDMGAYEKTLTTAGNIDCIAFSGFTNCNGVMTYVNEDDYTTGSVTVNFSTIPASGTLDLSGTALVGTASVDVASLSGNFHIFNNVQILATGQEVEITASFSDNSGSASGMVTTPFPCSRYVFTGTGNWDVPANWQDNNQPANSGNNRHITYLGEAVIYPGMGFGSFGDSVVVAMGGSLDIQQSVTFSKSDGTVNGTGGFENNGTVTLTGNGTATFPNMDLYNNGDFTINGGSNGLSMSGAANLFNTGTITNLKKLQAYSNITNYSTGVINNQADFYFTSGVFTNEGEFTHNWPGNSLNWFMGVNNSGIFTIEAGTISFQQTTNAYFTNTGTVTNSGNISFLFNPIVTNGSEGFFYNYGTITLSNGIVQNGTFLNHVGSTLTIQSSGLLENNGTLTNNGTLSQEQNAKVRNNNLILQNATMNCKAPEGLLENNDSLLVSPGATINITGVVFVFDNTATGTFVLDGTMTAGNQFSSQFSNNGIMKGNGTLDNSAGRIFDNNASGHIQPGASPGTLTIHKLNNLGSIDIEIGGDMAGTEYDVLNLPATSTIGGTLNVTLVDGFEPACGDVFDIITHAAATGTFATLNLPEGFSVGYPANKVTVSFGEMSLSIDNLSEADCGGTTCTTDDIFTADVTVTYGAVPTSGTLELTGPTIVGSVAAVNVGELATNSHTFAGVTLIADGGNIDLTATFSDGCDYNDGSLGTAPDCGGSTYTPTDIIVSGFGCFGPGGTYTSNGTVNGAPAWLSGFGFKIEWSGSQWKIKGQSIIWSANSTGSITNLPCSTGWTDPTGCALSPGSIALSGGCGNLTGGSGPACAITDIALSNTGSCNDSGTTDGTDDYFTTDVTVTFAYAPEGGTLTLKQGNTILTTTSIDLTCTTSHTFTGVQLPSEGSDVILTAEFSGDCTYTSGTLMTAPEPCSCVPASFTACPGPQTVNTSGNTCQAVVNYTATASGSPNPVLTYVFTGATMGTSGGTGSGSTFNLGMTNVVVVATNGCGSESCMFTITVEDNTPPMATCKNHTAVLDGNGSASITPADVYQSGSDNCTTVNLLSVVPNTFTCNNIFMNNTVTLTAYDASGNQSTCTANVTVKDETAPDLVCKNHSVSLGADGSATIAPADVHQSSSDNCGMVNLVSVSPSWLGCNNAGPNTVTLTANDGHGNAQTCTATVTVADGMAPNAHCKNATVVLDVDGNGSLAASSVDNNSSDNCGIASMAVLPNTFTCAEVGANTVTLTVTDNNNNTGTCTATVTVEDSTAPTANCTAQTVQATLGSNAEYTIDPAGLNDGSSDACGIQSLSVSPSQLNCQNEGTNTVTLTVADPSGNTSTCTATVEVASFLTINSIVSTNETCVGFADGSITISATSGGGQIGYSIDGGANFQLVSNTFALLTPGTYNIVVKVFGIPGVCEKTGVATVGAGSGQVVWYNDSDNDGYSDGNTVTACSQPAGYIANPLAGTDCNDGDASIHPSATEICDGLDNDCNGSIPASEADNDGDGYRACDGDCNDSNPDIHPGATEVCNGLDDNCDGGADEGLSGETYTGNVAFYTQAQVDAWPPCYSAINGNVMINGAGINNLGPLSNITEITGNLTVQTTGLTSMAGLNSLAEVGGTVTVFFNSPLTTLDGLEALNSVGGSLYIYYNFQLNDCCAVYNLINGGVAGPVVIFYNKVGCNSVVEINSNCQSAPLVGGPGNSTLNSQAAILVEERSLSVYPNPATGVVSVLFDPVATTALLEIRGGLGQLVLAKPLGAGTGRLDIDLNNREFASGIYFISLMENGQKTTKKLVVQH